MHNSNHSNHTHYEQKITWHTIYDYSTPRVNQDIEIRVLALHFVSWHKAWLTSWQPLFRSQGSIRFYYIIQYSNLAYCLANCYFSQIKIASTQRAKFFPYLKPKIAIPYVLKKKAETLRSIYVRGHLEVIQNGHRKFVVWMTKCIGLPFEK